MKRGYNKGRGDVTFFAVVIPGEFTEYIYNMEEILKAKKANRKPRKKNKAEEKDDSDITKLSERAVLLKSILTLEEEEEEKEEKEDFLEMERKFLTSSDNFFISNEDVLEFKLEVDVSGEGVMS